MRTTRLFWTTLSAVSILCGQAAGQQKRKPGAAFGTEVRFFDEKQPAGGTVQLKLHMTEPKPITSGTKLVGLDQFTFDEVLGISLWSPAGDVFGVARFQNGTLRVESISPLASFGTLVDYPILTIAAHIRSDATAGYAIPLSIGAGSVFRNVFGLTEPFLESRPGTLTVGGTASIHNVLPGGGTWPAGTIIRIVGSGFDPAARIRTKFKTASEQVVNATEIRLVLGETVTMDAQKITITNPNRDTVEYYAYLRGVPQGQSLQPVVATARAIFPRTKAQRSTITQHPSGLGGAVLTALALQNPNAESAQVELVAWTQASGVLARGKVTLAFGEEITRELGEYFGRKLNPGTLVHVSANVPLQVVSFTADSSSGELKPVPSLPF